MRFLFLFLISFSVAAAYKAPVSEVEKKLLDCSYPLVVSLSCQGECIEIKKDFKCETFKLDQEMVDDIDSPIFAAKEDIEICLDSNDCQSKHEAKICTNQSDGFYPVMNLDFMESYCTKVMGYNKKPSGRKIAVIDQAKKLQHDSDMANRKASMDTLKNDAKAIRTKLKNGNALSQSEIEKALKLLLGE